MKKAKAKETESKMLTDMELELMSLLWKIGEGSVADVMAELPRERELAYTSVSTILRILEQKGVLKNRKEGRGHIYIPLLQKSDYEATALKDVIDRVFEGTPVALVKQLLDSSKLDGKALEELRKLIDQAEAKK